MFKKTILSIFVLLGIGANHLSANCCFNDSNGEDFHFYIGAVGGVAHLNGGYRALNSAVGDKHFAAQGSIDGLAGGVIGLSANLCSNLYVAIQANALYRSLDKKVRSSTTSDGTLNHVVRIKNNFQYGIDARIGFNLSGATPYILAGIEAGKFVLNLRNESAVFSRGIPPFSIIEHKKTLCGPKLGIGVNIPISCNWMANLEYSYIWFQPLHRTLLDTSTEVSWSHKSNIGQNSFLAGVNYLF